MLQPVGEEAGQVLAHFHRHHRAAAHERDQGIGAAFAAVRAHHHFDQWHQVRRHEEMQAQHAFARTQPGTDRADREARAVAGEHRVRPRAPDQVGEQLLLEFQALGDALDHQVDGLPADLVQRGGHGQACGAFGAADGGQVAAHPLGQRGAARGVRLDHGGAAQGAGQHHGDICAHGAAAHHHRMGGAGAAQRAGGDRFGRVRHRYSGEILRDWRAARRPQWRPGQRNPGSVENSL
ncbi:hypothetical protein D9M70_497020 [compost metagenome]